MSIAEAALAVLEAARHDDQTGHAHVGACSHAFTDTIGTLLTIDPDLSATKALLETGAAVERLEGLHNAPVRLRLTHPDDGHFGHGVHWRVQTNVWGRGNIEGDGSTLLAAIAAALKDER